MIEFLKNLTLRNCDNTKLTSNESKQIVDLLENCIGKSEYGFLTLISLSEKRCKNFFNECANNPFVKVLETDDENAVNLIFDNVKVTNAILIIETNKDCKISDLNPKFTTVKKCEIAIRFNDNLKTKFRLTALYF